MQCEICICLNAQLLAAIEQGSREKLRKAQELIARHNKEHTERDFARARDEAQANMATPARGWES